MSLASSLASANAWVDARVAAHGDSAAAAALVLALAYALTYLFAARLPGARAEGYVLEFDVTPRYSRPRLYRLNGLRVLLAAALVFAAAARLELLPADFFARHFSHCAAAACADGLICLWNIFA